MSKWTPDVIMHGILSVIAICASTVLAALGRIDPTIAVVIIVSLASVSAGSQLGAANLAKGVALGVPLSSGDAAPQAAPASEKVSFNG